MFQLEGFKTTSMEYGSTIYKDWLKSLQWRHDGRESVSNHQPHDCLLNRLFRYRSKKTSKFSITGLCAGNSPASIWWRHHGDLGCENVVWPHQDITEPMSTVKELVKLKSIIIIFIQGNVVHLNMLSPKFQPFYSDPKLFRFTVSAHLITHLTINKCYRCFTNVTNINYHTNHANEVISMITYDYGYFSTFYQYWFKISSKSHEKKSKSTK